MDTESERRRASQVGTPRPAGLVPLGQPAGGGGVIGDGAGAGVRPEPPGLAGQGKRFGVITRSVHQKGVLGKGGAWLRGKKQRRPGRWVGREAVA